MSGKAKTNKQSAAGKTPPPALRAQGSAPEGGGRIRRMLSTVGNILRRGKGKTRSTDEMLAGPKPSRGVDPSGGQTAARSVRRQTDIPMNVLDNTYTPPATSAKAGFRSTGADHQKDQEFAAGVAYERWNEEDQFTNKSGDPRIGTHGRTYEPGESRDESRNR
jgi:hypothetical protein